MALPSTFHQAVVGNTELLQESKFNVVSGRYVQSCFHSIDKS